MDPTQVDANYQVRNLPTPVGADTHWQQFPPWVPTDGIYNDLDITSLRGSSPGLVSPFANFDANVPRPRILMVAAETSTTFLTGIDTSIAGVIDYPILLASVLADYFVAGGIRLCNHYGIHYDNYTSLLPTPGSAVNNWFSIQRMDVPFSANVNLSSSPSIHVNSISAGHTIKVDYLVVGPGIPSGTFVQIVFGSTITVNQNTTSSASNVTVYFIPSMLLGDGQTALLIPIPQGVNTSVSPFAYGGWNVLVSA